MSITTTTHINLRGTARAALEFHQSVFGGDLVAITYADAHNVQDPQGSEQVMWGEVDLPEGFHVMIYDVPSSPAWSPGDQSFFVSVRGTDVEQVTDYWKRLSAQAPSCNHWRRPPGRRLTECSHISSALPGFSTAAPASRPHIGLVSRVIPSVCGVGVSA